MGKTKETTTTTAETKPSRFQALKEKAHKAGDVLGKYEGQGPKEILEEGEEATLIDFKQLLGRPVIVTGFSMRSGQKGPFAVICLVEPETEEVMVTTCGGAVVLEKLNETSMKNLFPLECTFQKPEGKEYYTLS